MRPAVLLISPGILRWTDQDFGLPHLVSIGGYLEAHTGARVEILDLGYEGGDHRSLAKTLAELGLFVLIGLSAYSSFDYRRVMSVARFLKDIYPDVPLVAGGYHASALPVDIVHEGSPFDAVVVGEGERPLAAIVTTLLGGGRLDAKVYGPDLVMELDTLPPYRWDLLRRYWPRAYDIGRKFQIYLSRGCPYHCTFCMERAKSGYTWRAYSADRAVDELKRLATFTDLGRWVVNVADPLFGFARRWRREVLGGVIREGLLPRQYWTLTRSDDLDDEDVSLLARARFSIGIGLESGSPRMLGIMQKGNTPGAYLDAMLRLADLSRRHGLTWAANVIIGHPGETRESMQETRDYLERLYLAAPDTCGWLSIDPFRLYPGADVFERLPEWERVHGARFHRPDWWKHWYDGAFYAQHIEPSGTLGYEERVRFMHDAYGPFVAEVQRRFRGQGRSIDRVFERSLDEQREQLSPAARDRLITRGRRALREVARPAETQVNRPIGLRIRDPRVRRREEAVRRLLESGVLRSERVIEALLEVDPERFMPVGDAEAILRDDPRAPELEGQAAWAPGIRTIALGLEALRLGAGDRAVDLAARGGYLAAVLAEIVGSEGEVVAVHVGVDVGPLRAVLPERVRVLGRTPTAPWEVDGPFDGVWIGAALPRVPRGLVDILRDGGRVVTALGPRFREQDLVVLTRRDAQLEERAIARVRLPVLGGWAGWVPAPTPPFDQPAVHVARWSAPALAFAVFRHVDLGADAASCFAPGPSPPGPWAAIAEAWLAAPGRLALVGEVLRHRATHDLVRALEEGPNGLRDPAGRALCARFVEGLAALPPEPAPGEPTGVSSLVDTLTHLRGMLYESAGRPPPLVVLDCPALGPRGRATTRDGLRRVAVSLDQGIEHVVMLVLHEEMHSITDPFVLDGRDAATRDTCVASAGFALHVELEQMAIDATEALLAAKAPGWLPAFQRWLGVTLGGEGG